VKQCGNALLDLFSHYTRTKACVGGMGCVTSQGALVGRVVLMNGGVFRRTLKILFRNMVWLSLRWLSVAYSAYIWNLSSVLRCAPLLWCSNICIVL
jgi:hypothetical protein